jgi:DNA repair exonuclease SbcCD ATPase subunit
VSQSNVRLSHEIEAVRERISERDRDVRDLQNALKGLESDKRRIGDDHMDDRRSLELEIDRVKRDLGRSQDDLEHAQQEIDRLETSLSQQRAELSDMVSLMANRLRSGLRLTSCHAGGRKELYRVATHLGTSGAPEAI